MIDITMTATLRPTIVQQTLESFCNNLFIERDRYRLIVNVDPIGENVSQEDVVNVCKRYFKNVVYNFPLVPSFPKAVKWAWEQTNTDFVFHLEDDWILTRKLDINEMIRVLNKDESIACLRLLKYGVSTKPQIKVFATTYNYRGDNYYVTESNNQFGLNPVLIKKAFVEAAIPILTETSNPEKQFRPSKNEKMNNLINSWKFAIYTFPGSKAIVVDNGMNWKEKRKLKKPNNGFLVWEKY